MICKHQSFDILLNSEYSHTQFKQAEQTEIHTTMAQTFPVRPDKSFLEHCVRPLPALPVPNLGYCCINTELSNIKPAKNKIFTNRTCVKATFKAKGIGYISSLVLQNVTDLAAIIYWNHENNIRMFRISSDIVPWMSEINLVDLPDYEAIKDGLQFCGDLARLYEQRLSFHPSHFCCLASPNEKTVQNSLKELETHSQIFDLMGYNEPSVWTKINIHLGGSYGDKDAALKRWEISFNKLSARSKLRLCLENDDRPNLYTSEDLVPFCKKLGIIHLIDVHHQLCAPCPTWDSRKAFLESLSTWPPGIRPVIHMSQSQPGKLKRAHSDLIDSLPDYLFDHLDKIDIQFEAKLKETSLLNFRDNIWPRFKIDNNL